ncbi:MAG: 30S ribosomal protein S20 [Gammaproteobacteria bacterium]|nr:30S ribosomal protein S20 [Gammaproteobacteria bacterium]
MANSNQAKKRARQNEMRRQQNASQRSMMRTQIKKVVAAANSGDKSQANEALKSALPIIDRMADKDLIHKNKAARLKSRLNKRVRDLA